MVHSSFTRGVARCVLVCLSHFIVVPTTQCRPMQRLPGLWSWVRSVLWVLGTMPHWVGVVIYSKASNLTALFVPFHRSKHRDAFADCESSLQWRRFLCVTVNAICELQWHAQGLGNTTGNSCGRKEKKPLNKAICTFIFFVCDVRF